MNGLLKKHQRTYMKYISLKKILIPALLLVSMQSFSQSLTPLVVGTVNRKDSIVIYYDVTINAGAGTTVTNQGAVSGSNFTGFNTNDPDTGPAGDPTITQLNMYPLPVRLLQLKAIVRNGAIQVSWNVNNEENMVKYEVEKSINGRTFGKIGEAAALNSGRATNYSFIDQSPNSGVNYYRLRLIDVNRAPEYSLIVRVDMDGGNDNIRIFPNPVVHQTFTLQLSNMQKGNYELLIYNGIGQIAWRQTIYHDGGSTTKNISLPAQLSKGIYNVQLKSGKTLFNQSLMIQ